MDGPSANGMLHGRIFIVHVSRAGLFWSKLILQRKEIWLRSSDERSDQLDNRISLKESVAGQGPQQRLVGLLQ